MKRTPEQLDPQAQRRFALDVLRRLRRAGYEAYWAGGCVRDLLMGHTPKDYDVATNATPRQVRKLFGRRRTVPVGAAFGVILVVGPPRAGTVEVTTFRTEGPYSDGRHPDQVRYATAREDVLRRDFTINGMLYDPETDRVLDWVGGQEDLRRGIIRAIGDPRERFAEDHLRMFRAVRFAARFGFRIEPETFQAVREMAPKITSVSRERLAVELELLLVDASRRRGLELMEETGLLGVLLPEVDRLGQVPNPERPQEDLWQHTLRVLELLPEPEFPLALAALLHECGVPEARSSTGDLAPEDELPSWLRRAAEQGARLADRFARRWRLSNTVRKETSWLVEHQRSLRRADRLPWSRVQPLLAAPWAGNLLTLHQADMEALGLDTSPLEFCRQKLALPPEELDPPPLVTGEDLKSLGLQPGPRFGRLLAWVRDQQLDGLLHTREEALKAVRRRLEEESAG